VLRVDEIGAVMHDDSPFRVLRARPLWITSGVITGVLAVLFTVFYVGANIDPVDHLKNLPVGLVNADEGADVDARQVNLGEQIIASIEKSTADGDDKIDWKVMDRNEMENELGKGKLFGALVVPDNFTSSVIALTDTATTATPARPTLTVLTNQSAGSVGSSLARAATTQAAETASLQVGAELTAQDRIGQAKLPAAARVLLADPAIVTVEDGHPLDTHSGLGLTAFYYSLVLVVCGMLAANLISGQVDHALGYTHNDLGPLRRHHPLIRATRVQTLAISSTLMAGLSLPIGTLVMVAAVTVMRMDASHLPLLWLYSVATIAVVGIGALSLLGVFGTPGLLLVTLFYIGMAVPTAGATTPIQALPGFYRFLAEFEPLRQITDGIRSILYYNAQGDAGLTRGWAMLAVGLAVGALFGFGVTGWYDRKGLHRIPPETNPETTAVAA
jgi:YhgE/Pip-like protein